MTPTLRHCASPFVSALLCVLCGSIIAAERPNILLFLADDLGYADIGVNGCKDIPTPNIDNIAKNGVRFTDGYATHCVCSPSRAGLMSGMYQHRFGFEANSGPEKYAADNFGLPREIPTLAEKLKAAGYATGMIGKWHIGFKEGLRPHERGFDYHFGFLSGARSYLPGKADNDPVVRNGEPVTTMKYLTDEFADEAESFVERSKDKPFFLYFAFNAVHSPMDANPYSAALSGITDKKRRTYGGMLSGLDAAVGRVLAKVRDLGQEENTLIFFYSDNGGPTHQTTSRNDPLRGEKGQFYEGGIRVPFLMQWKAKVKAGSTYTQPVMGFDCHATALAASGISIPEDKPLDGVNLLPLLNAELTGAPHEFLCWRAGTQKAIRMGDWKLVQEGRSGSVELFNLKTDLSETTDLAAKEKTKFDELAAKFAEWEKGTQPAKWGRQDARNAEAGGAPKSASTAKSSAKATNRIDDAFKKADTNNDGQLTREEYPQKEVFDAVDTNKDGQATLEEVRAYYRNRRERGASNKDTEASVGDKPALKTLPDSDAVRDAAGTGQLFECVHVPGITDVREGMNGFALADLNRDGRPDLIATYSPPLSAGQSPLAVLINEGGFRFKTHEITLNGTKLTLADFGPAAQIPNLADFNGDGFLDILVSCSSSTSGGVNRRGIDPLGITFLLSDGAWDRFVDVSAQMGARNELGYNRQISIGDVNGDGWLDRAVGCDNIKNAHGGLPHSRLYVFKVGQALLPVGTEKGTGKSARATFLDGKFEDIGGSDLVPDFGGFYHDSAKDKAGPGISLRDLDNDGALDVVVMNRSESDVAQREDEDLHRHRSGREPPTSLNVFGTVFMAARGGPAFAGLLTRGV